MHDIPIYKYLSTCQISIDSFFHKTFLFGSTMWSAAQRKYIELTMWMIKWQETKEQWLALLFLVFGLECTFSWNVKRVYQFYTLLDPWLDYKYQVPNTFNGNDEEEKSFNHGMLN